MDSASLSTDSATPSSPSSLVSSSSLGTHIRIGAVDELERRRFVGRCCVGGLPKVVVMIAVEDSTWEDRFSVGRLVTVSSAVSKWVSSAAAAAREGEETTSMTSSSSSCVLRGRNSSLANFLVAFPSNVSQAIMALKKGALLNVPDSLSDNTNGVDACCAVR